MKGGDIIVNKIEIIGKVSSASDIKKDINDNEFMFFDLVQYSNKKESFFYKVRMDKNLIDNYKELILKGNNLYVSGQLRMYKKKNNLIYYIYPKIIKLFENEQTIGKDVDGVDTWNGKRCEAIPASEEEIKDIEELLHKF